jgi:zinc D-Ala-D-Ala carboxypeptidase
MTFIRIRQPKIFDVWKERWPNFQPKEVLGKSGYKLFLDRGEIMINEIAMDKLQEFRRLVGYPIKVNSGFRTYEENLKVEGKPFSRHMQGLAFDITTKEVSPTVLYRDAVNFKWHGIGLYNTFVHVDWRPILDGKIRKWDNRNVRD